MSRHVHSNWKSRDRVHHHKILAVLRRSLAVATCDMELGHVPKILLQHDLHSNLSELPDKIDVWPASGPHVKG